jgi:hypothetical protein
MAGALLLDEQVTPYERVVAALKASGSRRSGNNWQCQAHDDDTPSLSVKESKTWDGSPTVLINCFAGCSTTEEILPALGLEASDLFGNGKPRQTRLFPPERFSPVRRSGWLALPASVGTHFGVATTFGRLLCADGTFRRVSTTRDTIAVVLRSKDRKALRDTLDISASQLRNEVIVWRESSMAHACSRDVLTLYVRPEERCPYCRTQPTNGAADSKAQPTNGARGRERNPAMALIGTDSYQPSAGSLKSYREDGGSDYLGGVKALEGLASKNMRPQKAGDPYPEGDGAPDWRG